MFQYFGGFLCCRPIHVDGERAGSDLHVNEVNEKPARAPGRPASVQFPPQSLTPPSLSLTLAFISISLKFSREFHLPVIDHTFQNSITFHLEIPMDASFGGDGLSRREEERGKEGDRGAIM